MAVNFPCLARPSRYYVEASLHWHAAADFGDFSHGFIDPELASLSFSVEPSTFHFDEALLNSAPPGAGVDICAPKEVFTHKEFSATLTYPLLEPLAHSVPRPSFKTSSCEDDMSRTPSEIFLADRTTGEDRSPGAVPQQLEVDDVVSSPVTEPSTTVKVEVEAKPALAGVKRTRAPPRRRKSARASSPASRSSCSAGSIETLPPLNMATPPPVDEGNSMISCQVCQEPVDTNSIRKYIRCRKVCNMCRNSSSVMKDGKEKRFCQLCSWFHDIEKFEGERHSCRYALKKHNERRRSKTQAKARASET
eukprot:jgi/Tetstr1/442065/TSEL_030244.t1